MRVFQEESKVCTQSKFWHMRIRIKVLTLAFFSVVLIGYIVVVQYTYQKEFLARYSHTLDLIAKIENYAVVIHELQKERGLSVGYARGVVTGVGSLQEQRKATDSALALMPKNNENVSLPLEKCRLQVDQDGKKYRMIFYNYTQIISELIDGVLSVSLPTEDALLQLEKENCTRLMLATEYLGKIRATLYQVGTNNVLTSDEVDELTSLVNLYNYQMVCLVGAMDDYLPKKVKNFQESAQQKNVHDIIMNAIQSGVVTVDSKSWFAISTRSVDSLQGILLQELGNFKTAVQKNINKNKLYYYKFMTAITIVCGVILFLTVLIVLRILRPLNAIVHFVENSIETSSLTNRIELQLRNEFGVIASGINALMGLADRVIKEKEFLAFHDSLTGAYNRLRFNELFHFELQKHIRYNHIFSFVMLDIDHFKKVNDTFGHQAGDNVLKEIVRLAQGSIRINDIFARWGGEEFVLLLPETDANGGVAFSEKIRRKIQEHAFPEVGTVTVSIGLTAFEPGDTLGSMCARADQALYHSKKRGRNTVTLYQVSGMS